MIIVCPYDGIEDAVRRYRPTSAISILDCGEHAPEMQGIHQDQHLRLSLSMAAAEMMVPPCPEQEDQRIRDLIDFASRIDWTHALLVHCRLGLSRSPAAAFIIQCALAPARNEMQIAEELRTYSSQVEPSLMMVAKADELLGRQGRMIEAIDQIGFGDECMAGNLFEIPFLPEQPKSLSSIY